MMTPIDGDAIAEVVLAKFDQLPKKRKPLARADGVREWVPLAGIVAETPDGLECVALGTGMKCLPASKVPEAYGNVLHDWHAEIVALRAFNQFLLEDCKVLSSTAVAPSRFVCRKEITAAGAQTFAIKDEVKWHMYCSEAPCGDVSMELIMAAQEDATPWEIPPETDGASTNMLGRGYFSNLGIVRRKPSRPDAPPSLSKSCSDKIAVKQYISLVSSVTSLLVSPANTYLTSLVLPKVQYVEEAVQRCFGAEGRLQGLQGRTVGPYSFRPFQVLTTQKEFAYSRRDMAGNLHTGKILPSNIAAAWNPYIEETIIGGVLQGRKQNDPNGGSALSRRRLWALLHEISAAPLVQIREVDSVMTYQDIKQKTALALRAKAKETLQTVLPGWVSNVGDNSFSLK